MTRRFQFFCVLLAACFCGGCSVTPMRETETARPPLRRTTPEVAARRAAELQNLLAEVKIRGVGLRMPSFGAERYPVARLIQKVKELGFNRLYCGISSEAELDGRLEELIVEAARSGIGTELLIRQGYFFKRHLGNEIVRIFRPHYTTLPKLARKIAGFNASLPENARLTGVTAVCEPHVFTGERRSQHPSDLVYRWRPTSFGPGLDNDRMMTLSLELMRKVKRELGNLPFTMAFPDFYNELVKEKKLSCGSVADFAALSETVMIRGFGNKPSRAYARLADELAELPKDHRALVAINLADHTSVQSGALRRRDWNDFLRAMRYLLRHCRGTPCVGVVIAPLIEIEFMRYEQD